MSFKFNKKSVPTNNEPEEHDEDDMEEGEEGGDFNVPPDLRTIGLFGAVEEEKVTDLISAIMVLSEPKKKKVKDEEGNETEVVEPVKPIEFMLNTPGGNADEMFALYDVIRLYRDKCPINTFGVGKVMSAGVLLLAYFLTAASASSIFLFTFLISSVILVPVLLVDHFLM